LTPSPSHRFRSPWRPARQLFGTRAPTGTARDWLLDQESLTRRLRERWGTTFRVQVTAHLWTPPARDEVRLLGLKAGAQALIREVQLCDGEEPYVCARTVIPGSTLTGKHRRLACLGSRPLGAAIFADPSLRREKLDVARVGPGDPVFPGLHEQAWGRRSLFTLEAKPLIVYEVFLPEFFEERQQELTARAA
jgi:chorismate--pyruvate lyase